MDQTCFCHFAELPVCRRGDIVGFVDAAQEVLESLRDRWYQADNNPTDQLLNEMEFLSFLHPEHSTGMLKYMVREIVRDLGMCSTTITHPTLIHMRTQKVWIHVMNVHFVPARSFKRLCVLVLLHMHSMVTRIGSFFINLTFFFFAFFDLLFFVNNCTICSSSTFLCQRVGKCSRTETPRPSLRPER